MTKHESMELSIVTTMFSSAPYVREFYARVSAAARAVSTSYEIVLVHDGSPDDSLQIALELHRADPLVTVIDLSKNFGHHQAIMTGLEYARGEHIFLVDCDLEEPPELLSEFSARLAAEDCDVVYGVQELRKGGWFERLSGTLFYRAFNFLSGVEIPHNLMIVRLMTRRYVRALLRHRERELFLAGLWAITGFTQIGIPVKKNDKGSTTYTTSRKLALAINAITAFSDRPLRYIFNTGAMISLLAAAYIGYLLWRKIFMGIHVDGWTSLIVSIWFLGGLIIFFVGIIGIYISKVFIETKHRPISIVRQIFRRDEESP